MSNLIYLVSLIIILFMVLTICYHFSFIKLVRAEQEKITIALTAFIERTTILADLIKKLGDDRVQEKEERRKEGFKVYGGLKGRNAKSRS